MNYQEMIASYERCIEDCKACFNSMIGQRRDNDCPNCCVECIEACEMTIKAIRRNSLQIESYINLCSEICIYCAEQCEAHDHKQCQTCAESCRKCASLMRLSVAA